ncbi:gamma-aminobutyrate permease [Sporolactobacillus inulinus]|nr:amino acid permease [Sporolactobacillus inulinus]GEB77805.1 gamma-aminobutyrate permease [Sporolactobacillus inulinus]
MKKDSKNQLQRGLKSRHLTMISLGGAIGTGLFLASGNAIYTAGPGGALLAYGLTGVMVYFLMTSLGELATYMPISGSFSTYATRFVDPSFGFALGWNYWYNWAITIASELSAATLIMKFWFPDSPSMLWSGLFLAIIFLLNALTVKGYGESEYWFAIIKVVTVIVFIIIGLLMIFRILGGGVPGFSNFTVGDAPFHGGFLAAFGVFLAAGYSFQGTELLGVSAGESEHPEKNVPKAMNTIFWRILLFYILAMFVIAMILPYTNHNLSATDSVMVSPFTLVFDRAGLAVAASVMNAVILTAVLSAGNSGLYASTRMLYALAAEGKAPKFLGYVTRHGIPIWSLIVTAAFGLLAFFASSFGDGLVYNWLLSASGMCGFIAWLGIAISHYRFRRAYVAQGGKLSDLPYRAKWFPFGPLFAFAVCLIVIIGQSFGAFSGGKIDWGGIIAAYIGIPIFLAVWLIAKWKMKTKLIPLEQCDLSRHAD